MKSDKKIIEILNSMLSGDINLIKGCRMIANLRNRSSLNASDEVFYVFRTVDSETDNLYIDEDAKNLDREYFKRNKETVDNYLNRASYDILIGCKALLIKLDESAKNQNLSVMKAAIQLDSNWLMCPDCIDAWESASKDEMVTCPKCDQILHNPRYAKS